MDGITVVVRKNDARVHAAISHSFPVVESPSNGGGGPCHYYFLR
jgi:hypothetical protein